jgi:transcriptional regulator with PAS, ATPase and Fis domain
MKHDDDFGATSSHDVASFHANDGNDGTTAVTLVLHGRLGAELVRVPNGTSIVVGRAAPADVVLDDASLSRRHARISVKCSGVWVEDLGSKNGTRLDGKPVESGHLAPGSTLELGAVVVVLADSPSATSRFDEYERFRERLEQETARATELRGELSLLVVRAEGACVGWQERLRADLGRSAVTSRFGVDSVVVLLTGRCAEAAVETARALAATQATETSLFAGVASLASAGDATGLVEAARRACSAACAERPCVTAEAPAEPTGRVVVSASMLEVYRLAERAAQSPVPVLVLGETGTGKELVARSVHDASARRNGPFKAVNCAAIPATLAENVLFGHERGAFTGADQLRKGLFEEAHGGTVFLDEVGDLAPSAQASLLRALETKTVCRLGSTRELEVDVRLIAATHCDLEAMIAEKTFRADLYHRLNLFTIRVPSLRERPEDVVPLAEYFLERARREFRASVASLSAEALAALARHRWPGNVRELRNAIERAAVVGTGSAVELGDLPESLRGGQRDSERPSPSGESELPFGERVREYEIELIESAIERANGNQTLAARHLGMPLRTLVHKLGAYGLRDVARRRG